MFCQYFPFLFASCTPPPPSLLNCILCSFPGLTASSSRSWACYLALLPPFYFFCPCSFPASNVPTQTPPPHLSLMASDHLLLQVGPAVEKSKPLCSVSPVQEQPAETGRSPGKVPLKPWQLRGGACSLGLWGWQVTQTLMSPKLWWQRVRPQFSQKKNGQKFSTPMFNTTLLAMSWLWLVLPVWIAFHGDRRKHRYKIKSLLEAWRTSPETAMKIFFKKKKTKTLFCQVSFFRYWSSCWRWEK